MQRFPESTIATIADFRDCGWREAIATSSRDDYSSLWKSFSDAAKIAVENERLSQGKVLWLLADSCSMMLNPDSTNEPFKPFTVMSDGARSSLPEDFNAAETELLGEIAEEIDDQRVKARVADLVWLLKTPKSPKFAIAAIDAYRKLPLNYDAWLHDGDKNWKRAIGLSRTLGDGAGNRLREIESTLVSAFDAAREDEGFFALWLSEILFEYRLAQKRSNDIAVALKSFANSFEIDGDLHRSRSYFDAAARWFKRATDEVSAIEMTMRLAEGWVKEAVARIASQQPSHMVASSHYEHAIQIYRTIPRSARAAHRIDERLAELHKDLNDAGEKSLSEMGMISSPPFDISEIVKTSQDWVRGKSVLDAVAAFANIFQGIQVSRLRKSAEQLMCKHPLQSLFAATHMSRDGRVVAKRPSIGFANTDSNEYQSALRADMVKHYCMELQFGCASANFACLGNIVA